MARRRRRRASPRTVPRDTDPDLRSRGRELRGVLDEIREDLLDLHVVELDRRQILGDIQADRMAGGHRTHTPGDVLDERPDVVPRLVRHEGPVLDPREVEEGPDDAIQAKRLVLYRPGELLTLAFGPLDVALP